MKYLKRTLLAAVAVMSFMTASSQCCGNQQQFEFKPNWYVQAQGGAQYTLGEIDFGKLISPNVQVAVGYNFNPVIGTRLAVNAWQAKGGSELNGEVYDWKWNYVAPVADVTFNLSNLFCGFNPKRLVNVGIFAGIGANLAFKNGEAGDAAKAILSHYPTAIENNDQYLQNLWSGTKTRLMGQAGVTVDFRISDAVSAGVEINASTLNDNYNSKKAGNADWYFNALAGVKINLGKTYKMKECKSCMHHAAPAPAPKEIIKEVIKEKIVEKPVEVNVIKPLRLDIYFLLASTEVSTYEAQKVAALADYLKKHPDSKVEITGYADKGTGNATINKKLSQQRADVVANMLVKKYGIATDRIIKDSKGDTEQPYDVDVLNRVSICIAK